MESGTLTADGSTGVLKGSGVLVQCLFKGAFGGGIVELEVSQDNGITWYSTGDKFNADASFLLDPFKGKYKFTLSGAVSPSISYVIGGA